MQDHHPIFLARVFNLFTRHQQGHSGRVSVALQPAQLLQARPKILSGSYLKLRWASQRDDTAMCLHLGTEGHLTPCRRYEVGLGELHGCLCIHVEQGRHTLSLRPRWVVSVSGSVVPYLSLSGLL